MQGSWRHTVLWFAIAAHTLRALGCSAGHSDPDDQCGCAVGYACCPTNLQCIVPGEMCPWGDAGGTDSGARPTLVSKNRAGTDSRASAADAGDSEAGRADVTGSEASSASGGHEDIGSEAEGNADDAASSSVDWPARE